MTSVRVTLLAVVAAAAAWTVAAAQELPAAGGGAPPVAGSPGQKAELPAYNPPRRDPFRPFTLDLKMQRVERGPLTPLQKFELGQLKVAGVVAGMSPPRAVVEDSSGMGYIVTIGTPMGRNGGVVRAIEPGRIIVEENVFDFYGKEHVNRVVLSVPAEDGGGE